MRFLRQSLTGLFLLSLTLGLLVYAGQLVFSAVQVRISEEQDAPQRRERVFAVNVIEAEIDTIRPTLTAFGQVQSLRQLELRAKTAGTLVELDTVFVEGGQVQQGQVLARVDPANAQSALERAESDRLDAQAEVREAARGLDLAKDEVSAATDQAALRQKAFERQTDLEGRGVGTAATVEIAELAAAQARQTVLSSRQALALAEARVDQAATRLARANIAQGEAARNLADTTIAAEFAGTLAEVSVVQGGVVSVNEQLALLIDPNTLEVAFRISTAQYGRLLDAEGRLNKADVSVTMGTFGLELSTTGTISRDSAAVGEGQTGRLIFARMDAPGGMKPGDFVTVTVTEPALEQVVHLPATALGGDGQVLVVDAQGRLEAIPVTLLRRQGDTVLVRNPALDGQQVVTNRSPLLGKGIKVRVLTPEATAQVQSDDTAMLELDEERRARLIAFVQSNTEMPDAVKTRLLDQLAGAEVPERMVMRLERRMGG